MQVLPVIIPYSRTTSNIAISCRALRVWLSNNGFPIKSTKKLCLETYSFYKLLEHPGIDKWTIKAFSDVIEDNDSDRLKLLLDKGANIEAKDYHGCTPLILTALYGKVECLELLLDRGANIKARSAYRNTALSLAASEGRIECLKLLLEYGSKVYSGLRKKYPQYAELWGDSTL